MRSAERIGSPHSTQPAFFSRAVLIAFAMVAGAVVFISCSSASADSQMRKDATIALELSGLYRSNGDSEGEISALQSYVDQYSLEADAQISYNLAMRHFEDGDCEKALEVCDKCFDAFPAHVRFWRLAYACHMEMGDELMAMETLEHILHSGAELKENDILQACSLADSSGDSDYKKMAIEVAMENGLFTKSILEIASRIDPGYDEYDMLLLYAR